jgi:NAD(P)-dependent dehydrogenase (short-subunit alcohol dehydrogenase family)
VALTDPSELLRANLLEGVRVMLTGEPADSPAGVMGAAAVEVCGALGASVRRCQPQALEQDSLDAEVKCAGAIDLLVVDGAGLFAGGLSEGGDGHRALRRCLDCAWNVTRSVVNLAFLPGGGGRIVYLAPSSADGQFSEAAGAALENLTRTLSVEWARHDITAVTILPGAQSAASEVTSLLAYLASPAGAYFSGCRLDLGGAPPSA